MPIEALRPFCVDRKTFILYHTIMGKGKNKVNAKIKTSSLAQAPKNSLTSYLNLNFLSVVLIGIFSIVIYISTLKNGFVYDDHQTIVDNTLIKDFVNFPKLFLHDYFELSGEGSYRPVVTFSYFIDYALYELSPWGYHLTNVFFHTVNGLLLYIFLTLVNGSDTVRLKSRLPLLTDPPLLAALLFVSHPILSEAVNAISFREDLLTFLFYIATLNLYLVSRGSVNRLPQTTIITLYAASYVTYFLALLSKEMALTLPLVVFCYEWIYKDREACFKTLLNYRFVGYIFITFTYIYLRFFLFNNPIEEDRLVVWTFIERFMTIPWLLFSYLKLTILPVSLSVDYEIFPIATLSSPSFILSLVAILPLLILSWYFREWRREVSFGILFFVLSLIPVYNLIPIARPFADRYMYLPLAGLIVVTLPFLRLIFKTQIPRPKGYLFISFFALVTIYSLGVINRNNVWESDYSLALDTIKKSPDSYRAHHGLAEAYRKQGKLDKAIEHYEIAIRLKPNNPLYHFSLAELYSEKGLIEEAINEYKAAISLKSDDPAYYYNLGTIYFERRQLGDAIEQYQIALKLKPDFPSPYINLGLIYAGVGRFDEAIKLYQAALRLAPNNTNALFNIGVAYQNQNKFNEAIEHFQALLKLNPKDIEARYRLGTAFLNKGLTANAKEEFEFILRISPNDIPALKAVKSLK